MYWPFGKAELVEETFVRDTPAERFEKELQDRLVRETSFGASLRRLKHSPFSGSDKEHGNEKSV